MTAITRAPPPGPITVLRGHCDSINSLSYLSNSVILSGSGDGVIKAWDLGTRRAFVTTQAHSGASIVSVSSSPSTQTAISSGRDGYVYVWNIDSLNDSKDPLLSFYTGARHFCNSSIDKYAAATDGCQLALTPSEEESQAILWDMRQGPKKVAIIECPNESVKRGMACSLLLQSSRPSTQLLSNPNTDSNKNSEGSISEITAATGSDDDSGRRPGTMVRNTPSIFVGYEDGSMSLFDIRTYRELSNVKLQSEPLMCMDMSPDQRQVVTGGASATLKRAKVMVAPLGRDDGKYLPQTTPVVVASSSRPAAVKSTEDRGDKDKRGPVPVSGIGAALLAASSASSSSAAAASATKESGGPLPVAADDGASRRQNNSRGTQEAALPAVQYPATLIDFDGVELPTTGTGAVRYRSDGRIIVSGHWDGTVRIYDSKKLKPLAVLRHHRECVYAVDFSPHYDSSSGSALYGYDTTTTTSSAGMFATGSKDGTIAIWDIYADSLRSI